jgi:hypothetical protein
MQTNALQNQIEALKITIEQLLGVLHPGVVGLIHNNHGKEACDKACSSITNAKNAIADE